MNAAAAEFFTRTLWDEDAGAPAREYLGSRDIDRATADRFGLGFSPRDVRALRDYLNGMGYDDAAQIEAGLLVLREEKGPEPRPRFRNRLMFPIYDAQNRVIAFGGRVIGAGEPKYLNSAESPTFQKGSTLYGLNWAKNAIRKDERVLLVEGYFDCMRLLAAGVDSTVAPLGTALTDAQAELVRRYTTNVYLLYDSDKAGLKASFRAGDVLLRQGCTVQVVTLPDGEDPDTFVRRFGREKLEAQLGSAVDVLERKLQILQRGGWLNDLRRKRLALDRLLPTIAAAADPMTRGLYVARTAEAVGLSEDALQRELRQGSRKAGGRGRVAAPLERTTPEARARQGERRRELSTEGLSAERELVRILLHRRQFVESVAEQAGLNDFRDDRFADIFRHLVQSPDIALDAMAAALDDDAVAALNELSAQAGGLDDPARIIQGCVAQLRKREIGERIEVIDRRLPLAESAEKDSLNRQKQELVKEMRALKVQRWPAFRRAR
jgi:DNA primase